MARSNGLLLRFLQTETPRDQCVPGEDTAAATRGGTGGSDTFVLLHVLWSPPHTEHVSRTAEPPQAPPQSAPGRKSIPSCFCFMCSTVRANSDNTRTTWSYPGQSLSEWGSWYKTNEVCSMSVVSHKSHSEPLRLELAGNIIILAEHCFCWGFAYSISLAQKTSAH